MGTQTALRIIIVCACFCSAVFHAFGAAPTTNCVREAAPDFTYDANPGTHVLYLPGIATDFVFPATSGQFVQFPDGTATLTGNVFSQANPQKGFAIDIRLSG